MHNGFKEDSFYVRLVNVARYLNMTLMFIVQSALSVPSSIRQGASMIICKRANDSGELKALTEMLNLKTPEQKELLIKLGKSDAIFINKEKGAVPIAVFSPQYLTRTVTNEEIDQVQHDFLLQVLSSVLKDNTAKEKKEKVQETKEVDYNSKIIIQDLIRFPFDFQSERANRLDMNISTVSNILSNLVQQGILEKVSSKINLGKGRSPYQPYLFTQLGREKFGKQKIKGKGSLIHSFWQYRCKKYYERLGYGVEIEHYLKDGVSSVDLMAKDNKEDIAIEIELNEANHICDNIDKCISAGFSKLIIAVYTAKLYKYVSNILISESRFEALYKQKNIELLALPKILD